jgi:hypothetical protein
MRFERGPYIGPNVRFQYPKVFNCFRRQYYLERHSGYNIARIIDRQLEGGGQLAVKTDPISLLLPEIPLYTAPSHTEAWLKRPSGGSRANQARMLTRFRRNQPEN